MKCGGGFGQPRSGHHEFVRSDIVHPAGADGLEVGELAPEVELAAAGFGGGGAAVGVVAHVDDDVGVGGEDLFQGDFGESSSRGWGDVLATGDREKFVDVRAEAGGEHALQGTGSAVDDVKNRHRGARGGAGAELVEILAETGGEGLCLEIGAGDAASSLDGCEDVRDGIEFQFLDTEPEAAELRGKVDRVGDDKDDVGPLREDALKVGLYEGPDLRLGLGLGRVSAEGGDAGNSGAQAQSEEDLRDAGCGGDEAGGLRQGWRGG